ncbi:uncharacterized protein [Onthophagus taurus]|uniref:uncharacterized protein n=1 Tax=Onthophagus taurus TaxID=166361 RepID=UPI0039BE8B5A
MDKTDYINKAIAMLSDNEVYKVIEKDPLNNIQKQINTFIKCIQSQKFINDIEAKKLKTYNSGLAKAYFLPKIHKEDNPLRPIISSVGTPSYELSGYMANILSLAFNDRTDYNIKNTFQFVNDYNGYKLPRDYILISLDVSSLFTVIPLDLVNKIIEEKWDLVADQCGWDKNTFLLSLKLIFEALVFTFNGTIYRQIEGTPMGSKISSILALIVMDHVIDNI